MVLELWVETMVYMSLNGTPTLGTKCFVQEGNSLKSCQLAFSHLEPLPYKVGQGR